MEDTKESGENLTKFYVRENQKRINDTISDASETQFPEGCYGGKIENLNLKRKKECERQKEQFLQNLYHVQVCHMQFCLDVYEVFDAW